MNNFLPFLFKPVNVVVQLVGKRVNVVDLVITQVYGDHHHFEATLDKDALGGSLLNSPDQQVELIGSFLTVTFQEGYDIQGLNIKYTFKGVITKVSLISKNGHKGYLVISGSSPTIMLDRGERMDIYSNTILYNIFKKVSEGVFMDYMECINEPVFKNKIEFLMQYNETDWDFLKRIAYLFRENLFYSGTKILFGEYEDFEPIVLTYDKEISDLEFSSKMLPNNYEAYQYVSSEDTLIERSSPKSIKNSNSNLDFMEERNTFLTMNKPAKRSLDTPVYTSSEASDMLNREKSRTAGQTVTIKGKSKSFKATIGRLITILMPSDLSINNLSGETNLGTYRIIKSTHRIDEKQRYSNEFEAVLASLDVMPVDKPKMPVAESILGKVTSNEDPSGQGRVQVDFKFANQYSRIWMRVMTPNAGTTKGGQKNRGLVFVPEKGDQVMIGFEGGDPNRPYVMGSMFHSNNGSGGGENNQTKSIRTNSGIQIVFNDAQGSLNITDPSGNKILMGGDGNITITAPKKITLNASDIEINAGNSFALNAKPQGENGGEGTVSISAESWIDAQSNDNFLVSTKSILSMEGKGAVVVKNDDSNNISIAGVVDINGTQVQIN